MLRHKTCAALVAVGITTSATLLASLVATTAAPAAPTTPAPTAQPDTGSLDRNDPLVKAKMMVRADKIDDESHAKFGDRAGLPWMDDDTATEFVGVRGLTAADEARWTRTDSVLVDVPYSQVDLEAQQAKVLDSMGPQTKDTSYSVGFEMEGTGKDARWIVAVSGMVTPEQQDSIREVVPANTLRFKDLGAKGGWLVDRNSFPTNTPWLGALRNNTAILGAPYGNCTSGFLLASAFGYFGSTAAHCAPNGTTDGSASDPEVWMGYGASTPPSGAHIDYQRQTTWPWGHLCEAGANDVYTDVLTYSLTVGGWLRSVAVKETDAILTLVGARFNGSVGMGSPVWFSALSTTYPVGETVSTVGNIFVHDCVRSIHHDCITTTPHPGDSGGPVYSYFGNRIVAAGSISYATGPTRVCYSRINYTVFFTGQEVATQ